MCYTFFNGGGASVRLITDILPGQGQECLRCIILMSIIHRSAKMENGELRWQDIPVRAYGPDDSGADRATRQIMIGNEEGSPNFHMRYFAVQPGGHTSLDQHAHDHGVYVLHGCARVRLGDEEHTINAGDVVYISGHEIHQFFTLGEEPFGFLCIVPAKR